MGLSAPSLGESGYHAAPWVGSVMTQSNTGARGRPHACSTALAVTTALLRGGSAHHPSGKVVITSPPGWAAQLVCLVHHETWGAPLGWWTFTVWYPPHVPCVEPIAWTPRGGTPLLCCINDRVRAAPYHGMRRSGIAGEQVVCEGGLVLDFGLFPASEPTAQVLVELSGSPSGYGSCCLLA